MKCICCNNKIVSLHSDLSEEDSVFKCEEIGEEIENSRRKIKRYSKAENRMWNNGVVGNISAGFGSCYDGDQYVIGICDECIDDKLNDGSLACVGNYMFNTESMNNRLNDFKKVWRRINNLDKLL